MFLRYLNEDDSFWYNFNFFYVALVNKYYQVWKGGYKTIKDSGYVLQDIEKAARKNVDLLISDLNEHLKTFSLAEKQAARENIHKRVHKP